MSSAEFSDWVAYHVEEPFGEARADLRMGVLAATLANIHRAENRPPFKPADFMPFVTREPETEPDPRSFFEALKHGH